MSFRLPGRISNPLSRTKNLLMAAFAYSRHWNVRNLECYWYGPCGELVSSLVDDVQELVAIAQPVIWFRRRANNSRPAQHDPDRSIAHTVAARKVSAVIPDYAIYYLRASYRNRQLLPVNSVERRQKDIHVDDVRIPLVVEAKRYCHRAPTATANQIPGEEDMNVIRKRAEEAMEQAEKVARHVFKMYPQQKEIILAAFTGPFWRHKVMRNRNADAAIIDEDSDSESESENENEAEAEAEGDLTLLEQDDDDEAPAAEPQADDDDEGVDLRDAPLPAHMEDLYRATQDLLVLNAEWSEVCEMESLESRRALSAIHARLEVIPERYGTDQAWC
ncbi:hypothetical protein FA95DRAFT_1682556 [Auriscalpium vulgare]|uniref:Uncharacterized protein n=1 Tax=Auriscalpium vulgare TaxID=40419 RepID=A0ACB8RE63_9AGAM|nr:hypothetical protein FA95DRAFT_1682556 [Auriscalpium vulgare]